jgi:hypothetical protein
MAFAVFPSSHNTTSGVTIPGDQPIGANTRYVMHALVLLSFTSILSTSACLTFICYRAGAVVRKKRFSDLGGSVITLITQILLADLIQSNGFFLSIRWLINQNIEANSLVCFIQGFIINFGDMASAFFVLYMAVQTWFHFKYERLFVEKKKRVYMVVCGIWTFALVLSILGPAIRGYHYFAPTGAWASPKPLFSAPILLLTSMSLLQCWTQPRYGKERLLFHYAWIFLVEFSTILIYAMALMELRKKRNGLRESTRDMYFPTTSFTLINQWSRRAIMYPMVYTLLTLPLAVCRMVNFNKNIKVPAVAMCAVGCIITSCGWADSILYFWSRKALVQALIEPNNFGHELTTRHQHLVSGHNYIADTRKASRVTRATGA